jgi:hypothetical protein
MKDNRQIEFVVRGVWRTAYSDRNPPGSGYCEDQKLVQRLIRRTPRIFLWWRYWSEEVIDEEEVPSHAWISEGALGWSDWVSKFAPFKGGKCLDANGNPRTIPV